MGRTERVRSRCVKQQKFWRAQQDLDSVALTNAATNTHEQHNIQCTKYLYLSYFLSGQGPWLEVDRLGGATNRLSPMTALAVGKRSVAASVFTT